MKERVATAIRGSWSHLFEPIDIASLVFFRIAFGVLLSVEVGRYFASGWIKQFYIDPHFYFTYYGFGWVRPLPGDGMYYVFAALGILATCIVVGFAYRMATALFFAGFTYVFLIDQTRYLNHFYLISLISFLLIFVPAHRSLSLDSWLDPSLRSGTAPRWALWILRTQFAIVYIYGGIAKLNGDWLRGFPMGDMLRQNASLPVLGPYAGDHRVALLFAYGGLLFDLFIVPLLLWRPTRYPALLWASAFHLMNHSLFHIGVFPWFAMAGTLLFLPPDWPRRLMRKKLASSIPAVGASHPTKPRSRKRPEPVQSFATARVLVVFFALQILIPLRSLLYPGPASWTEQGQRFSWRMMLRAKVPVAGKFVAHDFYTGRKVAIMPARHLDRAQIAAMWIQPDMILQFAHFVEQELHRQGWQVVEVRSYVTVGLNGRRPQLLVDPDVNLAGIQRSLLPARWIMPLTEPLPAPGKSWSPAKDGREAHHRTR